jgi:hypothetical protein
MSTSDPPSTAPAATGAEAQRQALEDALRALLAPVARLAVARGLPYATVNEILKLAFVQAAAAAHPGLLAHRKASRVSIVTGINRREVTRLIQTPPEAALGGPSLASQVFAHWRTQRPYRGRDGRPRALPRQGPAPSFESLAQAVTRDVHPRSLLDELCRLGLAEWDKRRDRVALARDAFVPRGDPVRMLGFLADNVGDHLQAAVANVLDDDRAHFEQAVYADGLGADSLASVRPAIAQQWQSLLAALVPALEARVEADAALPPAQQGRLRVGLYSYQEGAPPPAAQGSQAPAPAPPAPEPRAKKRRT